MTQTIKVEKKKVKERRQKEMKEECALRPNGRNVAPAGTIKQQVDAIIRSGR